MHKLMTAVIGIITMTVLLLSTPFPGAEADGSIPKVTQEDCAAHGIPIEQCFICDKNLRQKGRMWCKEHGRYENRCFLCHPDLKDEKRPFCEEHFLYEDECMICRQGDGKEDGQEDGQNENKGKDIKTGAVCKLHGVDVQQCFICDKSVRQKGRMWCKEHGRYENRCFLCHPDLKDEKRPFCEEHFLYEDECIICNPQTDEKKKKGDAQKNDHKDTGKPHKHSHLLAPDKRLHCNEHNVFEDQCAICRPEMASELPPGGELKIRFNSLSAARKAGVTLGKPETLRVSAATKAYTEVSYNNNRLAQISPLANGVVREIFVNIGDYVDAGAVLVEIASTDVAAAKLKYVQANLDQRLAQKEYQRQLRLKKDRIAAERDVEKASAALERARMSATAARQGLANLDITDTEIETIANNNDTDAVLRIRAPFAGTVIQRTVVLGQAVEHGDALLQVADLTEMWLELSVPEGALPTLMLGQKVSAQFSAIPGVQVEGKLMWIGSSVDPRTRLLRARAVVENKRNVLKAGLYGEAVILLADEGTEGLGVPRSAIQYIDKAACLFVREADDLYVMRRVTLGAYKGDRVLIREGLRESDEVVIGNSHIVYSEMFKSKLGAGCVDD